MQGIWALALLSATPAIAQDVPAAIVQDPAPDAKHPAKLEQVRYSSGGVQVPARLFVASGEGRHNTVLLLHGFPGTELNLDLARAIQRAGWNVLAIHYRGVWGAPGKFSFAHTIEDANAALARLRAPPVAERYGVDTAKLVVLGHSMGGFDAVMLGRDPAVAGYVLISAANIGGDATALDTPAKRKAFEPNFADELSYTNANFADTADEILTNAKAWDWATRAAAMGRRPVLIVDSNDGNEPASDLAAAAIAAAGRAPARVKFATDHSYNDHRIALASAVVRWLETSFPDK